jgi:hypothetical protein
MDASDWFEDSPVPADLRAQVDTVLKPRFDALADQMKDSLNQWTGDGLDLEQTQLYQTISAFAGAMSTVGEGFEAYAGVMQTLVHATTRIGVGFVPVVGPALDLCEAVTGKAWCLPSGEELSTEERIFSGMGFGLGAVGPMWRAVSRAGGLTPDAIRVAEEIAQMGEELATALRAPRRTSYKTLRGAVTTKFIDAFERRAAKFLLDDGRALIGVGDDGVRTVLDIPRTAPAYSDIAKAPDFVTVTRGNKLAVSEAKSGTHVQEAIKQLTNALEALKKKGLAGDVTRVEMIIKKGVAFDDHNKIIKNGYLFDKATGQTVRISGEGFKHFVRIIEI